ncbi:unnamed protein product, partial [Cochlearia groenlandica]
MVFKHKLFSSSSSKKKKSSESSSSDNSPRSIGSNSPIGSDKKKSKSESGDETWRLNLRSLFAGGKDGSTKKKTDLSSSSSDSDSKPPCDVASKPPLVASSSIGWNRFDSRSDLGSVVPKVVTHLGSGSVPADSGSISADSGSVPADSGSVPADSGSVSAAYGSGLATSGSVSAASCLVSAAFGSGLAASGSVSAASGSVSAAFGSVSAASAAYGSVSDAYGSVLAASGSGLASRRSVSAASGSGLPASGSGRGNAKKEAESSSRPALPPSGAGKFKVRPSMSGPIGSSESENSKESESTRYLALLRLTSASRKRFPGDFKSFSQELNSKGLQLFPQWKPRRSSNMEEITNLIGGKFKKAKEEVDSDLLVFGGDLMGLLDSGHELQVEIENLLILARECDKYTSEEFWLKCESIVHELDDRRQELSPGVLKQLHSRMLFILTRCTRLLQFHKESWGQKQEIPTKKAYSQEQHCLDWKEDFPRPAPISSPEKYLKLCGILVDDKVNLSGTVIDGDAPLDDDVVHSSRTSSVHPRERTSIEDFEMLKPISKGAFGSVFLAKKKITGDLFAIKVLKKADTIRKNAVESILAERDILINAHNPFVVRFFYSFTCRENLYLVMEYLNGGDLYSLLAKIGRLDESIARVYIAELVLALEYIHSQGVVHRDLKPDNLLIAHDGHVKLTDFGLSKVGLINITDDLSGPVFKGESLLVEEKPKVPTSEYQLKRRDKRSVVGTPDYLAPEILLGKGHGATADWWSVGIILYELIVGIPPFNDAQPQQIFDNILNRDIPWPHIPDEMSYEAHDLIDRLLTADPHQRLGAKGAAEVKEHVFFKDINWHTLAEQKAAFVPETESALDTSYFQSRHSMNSLDLKRCRNNENGESSGSSSCLSNHHNDVVTSAKNPDHPQKLP